MWGNIPRPQLETLESRLMLSGDVHAAIVGGALKVTGDVADNAIQIDAAGLAQGQVRVFSLDGTTTVNGEDSVTLDGLAGKVDVRMGAGNDRVVVNAVSGKSLRLDGQAGDNDLTVLTCTFTGKLQTLDQAGTQAITIRDTHAASMAITTGGGDNTIAVHEPTVAGNITIKNKDGLQDVSISGGDIAGNISVKNGNGDNQFWMEFTNCIGKVSVANRKGDDILRVDDANLGSLIFSGGTGSVAANVTKTTLTKNWQIKNSGGADTILADSIQVKGMIGVKLNTTQAGTVDMGNSSAGKLQLSTGKADDAVTLTNVAVTGATKVQTNSGNDQVTLDNTGVAAGFGAVTVKAGTGDDQMHLGGTFGGKTTLNGGAGADLVEELAGVTFAVTPGMTGVETVA